MRSSYISAEDVETSSPRLKSEGCNHGAQFYFASSVATYKIKQLLCMARLDGFLRYKISPLYLRASDCWTEIERFVFFFNWCQLVVEFHREQIRHLSFI